MLWYVFWQSSVNFTPDIAMVAAVGVSRFVGEKEEEGSGVRVREGAGLPRVGKLGRELGRRLRGRVARAELNTEGGKRQGLHFDENKLAISRQ